jgi:hypothetical protein
MVIRMQIHLSDDELQAIQAISAKEMRTIREQIRYMLHHDLQQRGYLPAAPQEAQRPQLCNPPGPAEKQSL